LVKTFSRPLIVSAAFTANCCDITEETKDWKFVSGETELPIVQSGLSLMTLANRLSVAEISAVIRCIYARAIGFFDISLN
jgi:hypothetical protein